VKGCKPACGLCKGAKVDAAFQVAGGSLGWPVAKERFDSQAKQGASVAGLLH